MSLEIWEIYRTWKFNMTEAPVVHLPVMADEVVKYLEPEKRDFILDATCGTGGHSLRIVEKMKDSAVLVCNDWDPQALEVAKERLLRTEKQIIFTEFNFRDLHLICEKSGVLTFDAVLADLGISGLQIAEPVRGFSFMKEGPLDMRMSPLSPFNAWELVNKLNEHELARIIHLYGEEPYARKIAREIVKARSQGPINTTAELARIIEKVVKKRGRIHPATRTFQALRIAVNDELRNLEDFMKRLPEHLNSGARVVVISFHSLEDRIIKRTFRAWEKEGLGRLLTKKVITPCEEEVKVNPRSRSAKLRAFEWTGKG